MWLPGPPNPDFRIGMTWFGSLLLFVVCGFSNQEDEEFQTVDLQSKFATASRVYGTGTFEFVYLIFALQFSFLLQINCAR